MRIRTIIIAMLAMSSPATSYAESVGFMDNSRINWVGSEGVDLSVDDDDTASGSPVDVEEVNLCLRNVIRRPIQVMMMDDGYSILLPGVGRGFSRMISCGGGKATLSDVVMVNDVIRSEQVAGSAMKADRLLLWAQPQRNGCERPVDYGIELKNFRWFNWDERFTDGGNKRLEIIRNSDGREVRISTISHFRTSEILWAPKPAEAVTPCAPSGDLQVSNLDVRWSTNGTAYGLLSDSMSAQGTFPVMPDDARMAAADYGLRITLSDMIIRDITESSILRAARAEIDVEASPKSATPWAFLIRKYADALIFRQDDDSLIRRVLPLDLSNTLYFTRAIVRIRLPDSTAQTAALLPSYLAQDLSSVNMSSTRIQGRAELHINGPDPGELRLRSTVAGAGEVNAIVGFRTQMFGKDLIASAAKGTVDLYGKAGFALTGVSVRFRNDGLVPAFVSLFKSTPSTFLARNVKEDIEFWKDVSLWLREVEVGGEPSLMVRFATPKVMMKGFWGEAFRGAVAKVGG